MSSSTPALHHVKTALAAVLLVLVVALASTGTMAQNAPEPRREQLLNGLRVLLWNRPGDARVLLKLRIHSGAAFDMAGKPGTMALLGDALFPDPATHEYFTEELGGKLDVTTDYDSLNITLSGPATEFERIVDLLRTALVNPPPAADVVDRLREARAKLTRELSIAPTTVADRAIATRLFREHPYGRPFAGSTDSLARIQRADLLFARERFLSPNNATLVIVGGVDERRALRTLRQLLGGWRKSDALIPTTFRQPDAPDARTLLVDLPGAETAEVRLAVRGLARSDRDYPAATLLALLARDRWLAAFPELGRSAFFVRHEAHVLPGIFVMGASVPNSQAAQVLEMGRSVLLSLSTTQAPAADLERVRAEALAVLNKQSEQPETLAEAWLDSDTFKLPSLAEQARAFSAVTAADVQRVAARLFRDAPVATAVVGNATQLRAALERTGKVELLGEAPAPAIKEAAAPQKPKETAAPVKKIVLPPLKPSTITGPAKTP